MEQTPWLVIVGGPPGAGKTTFARSLADRYGMMLLHKDGIKEALFDALGWSDREWSKKVGLASYRVMYRILESALLAKQSCVIESNFSPDYDAPRFKEYADRFNVNIVEVYCRCRPEIAFERFRLRVETGERHPGHVDGENLQEFQKRVERWTHEPLDPTGEIIELDTSDFGAMDPAPVYARLDRLFGRDVAGENGTI